MHGSVHVEFMISDSGVWGRGSGASSVMEAVLVVARISGDELEA